MYLFASRIFLAGSISCGTVSTTIMLIVFRALQGIGGAGLFSLMTIIFSTMFEDLAERVRLDGWRLRFLLLRVPCWGVFVEHSP